MLAGIVGFDTDMGATKESEHNASSGTIATVRAGMQEIERRWGQPYRSTLWKHILPVSSHTTSHPCVLLATGIRVWLLGHLFVINPPVIFC